jgi:hypothetical protein
LLLLLLLLELLELELLPWLLPCWRCFGFLAMATVALRSDAFHTELPIFLPGSNPPVAAAISSYRYIAAASGSSPLTLLATDSDRDNDDDDSEAEAEAEAADDDDNIQPGSDDDDDDDNDWALLVRRRPPNPSSPEALFGRWF